MRVLSDLRWQVHDTEVVWPEYNVGNGRVDFALCDPPSKPKVFVEVKQPGAAQAEGAIDQALLYAFRTGVHYAVLTDGRTWNFYLPSEPGSYEERCVLKLDLYEESSRASRDALAHYLEYGRVASGEALEEARREYRDRFSRETARRALPEAWSKLVHEPDGLLVRLLADTVESQTKIRPVETDVLGFLRSLTGSRSVAIKEPPIPPPSNSMKSTKSRKRRCGSVIVASKRHTYKSMIEAMVTVLTEIQKVDRGFLDRFQHLGINGRKRIVGKNPIDIHPKSLSLRRRVGQLPDGWFVCKDFTVMEIIQVINDAADVSGISVEWNPPVEPR